MKKPIFLISTAGKSKEQLKKEVGRAFESYKKSKPSKKINKSEKNEQEESEIFFVHKKGVSEKRIEQIDLISKALDFAAIAHKGQTRNGGVLPYIVHPMGVALLLAKIGADDKTIAAGLLHDTIEDCDVTKEDLEKEFGKKVARIVNDVTEQDRSLSWHERKYQAIDHLKVVEKEALLVKSADIINNLSSTLEDIKAEGLAIFDRYNASYPDQVEMNRRRYEAIEERWGDNPLLPQLKELVDKLADKKFPRFVKVGSKIFKIAETPSGGLTSFRLEDSRWVPSGGYIASLEYEGSPLTPKEIASLPS